MSLHDLYDIFHDDPQGLIDDLTSISKGEIVNLKIENQGVSVNIDIPVAIYELIEWTVENHRLGTGRHIVSRVTGLPKQLARDIIISLDNACDVESPDVFHRGNLA